ncbi:MAG TPA: hypothetical protein VM282_26325 [Acidimicrobiales bacterium]|nr:hypothetical protein [Acidimicrobiales bacterium]
MHSCYQIPAAKPPIRCGGAAQVGVAVASDQRREVDRPHFWILRDDSQRGGRPRALRVETSQSLAQRRQRVVVGCALTQFDPRVRADEANRDAIDVAGRPGVERLQELDSSAKAGSPSVVVGDRAVGQSVDPIDIQQARAGVQGAAAADRRLGPTTKHEVDVAPHDLIEDFPPDQHSLILSPPSSHSPQDRRPARTTLVR